MKALYLFMSFAFVALASPAQAHKVVAAVYENGRTIEGEIGFSNGDMAANATVEVFDDAGNRLGEAQTDTDGVFEFTPKSAVTHVFRANLGAGHVAETVMDKADVAKILGSSASAPAAGASGPAVPVATAPVAGAQAPAGVTVASLTAEEREAIATAVREETKPLRKEIAAYKEKNDLQTILGGIGYIIGLFGVGFYMAARKRLQA